MVSVAEPKCPKGKVCAEVLNWKAKLACHTKGTSSYLLLDKKTGFVRSYVQRRVVHA